MVSFKHAFLFWLKLGFISFGGPAGQIAILHRELVERRRWISEQRFLHALNFCMVLPGPEAQQLATYLGWLMHRTWGGIVAGVLFVLPSLFILVGLSWVYVTYGQLDWIAGLFDGIKPAVVALVVHAAHRIGSRTLTNSLLIAVAALSFIAVALFGIPFPVIVLLAAVVGFAGSRLKPELFSGSAQSTHQKPAAPKPVAAAVPSKAVDESGGVKPQISRTDYFIDDHTPTPEHARFKKSRFLRVLLAGLALWALPIALLGSAFGAEHLLTRMGVFFTKAALLTFGGAYAVLPYVNQAAVETYQWLTPAQVMDGLALGESTPGPLIMVVAFVGFVAAHTQAFWGAEHAFWSGAVAAAVVTWFTFLPSFIFIFLGGPFIETTHQQLKLTAPLRTITAAVVGVILQLALYLGYHVFLPEGSLSTVHVQSLMLAAVAGFMLFRLQWNVFTVLGLCAMAGLILRLANL